MNTARLFNIVLVDNEPPPTIVVHWRTGETFLPMLRSGYFELIDVSSDGGYSKAKLKRKWKWICGTNNWANMVCDLPADHLQRNWSRQEFISALKLMEPLIRNPARWSYPPSQWRVLKIHWTRGLRQKLCITLDEKCSKYCPVK